MTEAAKVLRQAAELVGRGCREVRRGVEGDGIRADEDRDQPCEDCDRVTAALLRAAEIVEAGSDDA